MVLSSKLTPSKPNYLVLHQQCPKPLFTHVNMVNAAYNVHATCAHQAMNLAAATVHALPVKNVINSAKNIKLDWTEHIPAVTHLLFLSTIKIWMRMQEQKTLYRLIVYPIGWGTFNPEYNFIKYAGIPRSCKKCQVDLLGEFTMVSQPIRLILVDWLYAIFLIFFMAPQLVLFSHISSSWVE